LGELVYIGFPGAVIGAGFVPGKSRPNRRQLSLQYWKAIRKITSINKFRWLSLRRSPACFVSFSALSCIKLFFPDLKIEFSGLFSIYISPFIRNQMMRCSRCQATKGKKRAYTT
jgi:hypothetical protein